MTPYGRIGVTPEDQRNALAQAIGELLEKLSKSLVESGVAELTASKFPSDPSFGLGSGQPSMSVATAAALSCRQFTTRCPEPKLLFGRPLIQSGNRQHHLLPICG